MAVRLGLVAVALLVLLVGSVLVSWLLLTQGDNRFRSQDSDEEVRCMKPTLTDLIDRAPWRETITYRDTWPHEYVLTEKDNQRELLDAICPVFVTVRAWLAVSSG